MIRSCLGTGREKMYKTKCLSILKQIHTFTCIMLFEQRRFSLGCPSLYQVKSNGARETKTSFKQHDAGERVALLDDYDVTAITITETSFDFRQEGRKTERKRGERVRDDNKNGTRPPTSSRELLNLNERYLATSKWKTNW